VYFGRADDADRDDIRARRVGADAAEGGEKPFLWRIVTHGDPVETPRAVRSRPC
jgi:hypothetical protein